VSAPSFFIYSLSLWERVGKRERSFSETYPFLIYSLSLWERVGERECSFSGTYLFLILLPLPLREGWGEGAKL
jgi:hypothetical protein